ncbi:MAG: hypothetical protein ACOH2T_18990 [Pseudomonas sp.]
MATDLNKVHDLRMQLEELGCGVVIWVPEDFPGTPENRVKQMDEHMRYLLDYCVESGNNFISWNCHDDTEDQE